MISLLSTIFNPPQNYSFDHFWLLGKHSKLFHRSPLHRCIVHKSNNSFSFFIPPLEYSFGIFSYLVCKGVHLFGISGRGILSLLSMKCNHLSFTVSLPSPWSGWCSSVDTYRVGYMICWIMFGWVYLPALCRIVLVLRSSSCLGANPCRSGSPLILRFSLPFKHLNTLSIYLYLNVSQKNTYIGIQSNTNNEQKN